MHSDTSQTSEFQSLLTPARVGIAAVVGTFVLFLACVAHSLWNNQRLQPTMVLTRKNQLSDLCLTPTEDTRHPGWGRSEQAQAGQPSLPDPRGQRSLIHTVPMKVIK